MALPDNISELLNRSPARVAEEHVSQLYNRLYPMIQDDFIHKADVIAAFEHVLAAIESLAALIVDHTHALTASSPGAPTTPGIPAGAPLISPGMIPNDAIGESLVVPGGIPQPTGEGVALLPSRVPKNGKPIAVPPINPVDLI